MTGREGDPYYHELGQTRTTFVRYKDGEQEHYEDDRDRTRDGDRVQARTIDVSALGPGHKSEIRSSQVVRF